MANQASPPDPPSPKKRTQLPSPVLQEFRQQVGKKQQRMIWARQTSRSNVWFGLGLLGLVGWSVALPALLGIALGSWLDQQFPARFSWTLTLLLAGLLLGCFNAWRWVSQEQTSIARPPHSPQQLSGDDDD